MSLSHPKPPTTVSISLVFRLCRVSSIRWPTKTKNRVIYFSNGQCNPRKLESSPGAPTPRRG
nr:MAG: putative 6.8 kDa protein [Calystegia pelarspovirus 1]UVK78443.1 MAG: putative 6.8 kDa protein [Calystegia pelarspovirus 1]